MLHSIKYHKETHCLYSEPSRGSLGEYILLINSLRVQALENLIDDKQWIQMEFNAKFLEKKLAKYGELHCEYCGKPNLIIYGYSDTRPRINQATADHFIPRSVNKSLALSEDNLIVACTKCNGEKGNKLWPVNAIRFKYL